MASKTYPLTWDVPEERRYETGVSQGVLYVQNERGVYGDGVVWNGLISVSDSPEGAEPEKLYADDIPYLTLVSPEDLKLTISAYNYPDEFLVCDGTAQPIPGLMVAQQSRRKFGFSYRTKIGTAVNPDAGYKIHLIYNVLAAPSEQENTSINDSPEAKEFSWECSTEPVIIPGHKASAHISIDSTRLEAGKVKKLEEMLYGKGSVAPKLPTPTELFTLLSVGSVG